VAGRKESQGLIKIGGLIN